MNTDFYGQLFSLVWILTVGPMTIIQLLRALIHDRGYSVGYIDFVTGVSATTLILLGLPKF
jgi:hypothetical protein